MLPTGLWTCLLKLAFAMVYTVFVTVCLHDFVLVLQVATFIARSNLMPQALLLLMIPLKVT